MKEKIWYSSRFWIGLFGFVVAIFISLQLFLGLIQNGFIPFKYLNPEINLPLNTVAYSWAVLVGLYCGTDRAVDVANTISLKPGQLSMGDLAKLRHIILLSLFLVLYSLIGTVATNKDFALEAFFGAFAAATIIYCAGNKVVKTFKYSGKDNDNDGVPDEYQNEYEKWAREETKKGTKEEFITFDYFLDVHPDIEAKIRN